MINLSLEIHSLKKLVIPMDYLSYKCLERTKMHMLRRLRVYKTTRNHLIHKVEQKGMSLTTQSSRIILIKQKRRNISMPKSESIKIKSFKSSFVRISNHNKQKVGKNQEPVLNSKVQQRKKQNLSLSFAGV